MRHLFECPMRWADLDLLGHVNNVTYVDYLQEARVDMLHVHAPDTRASDLAEGTVVVRHEVTYLAELPFRFATVSIECWVTEIRAATFTMAYEVFEETEDGRRVFARALTVLTPYLFGEERPRRITAREREGLAVFHEPAERARPEVPAARHEPLGHYPVHVRFSDVDLYGHVNNVKYLEYLQEGRIRLATALTRGLDDESSRRRMLVVRTDVDYVRPVLHRPEPYDLWTWITHVGRTSVTLASEICDGDAVLARAQSVLVLWDREQRRPVEPTPAHRRALEAARDGVR